MGTKGDGVELVIFDCDGVLVDSERLAVRVESQLLTEMGWSLSETDVLERFVGRSDAHMLSEIEAHFGRPMPQWQADYEAALFAAIDEELEPVDGIHETLEAIDAAGLARCVASSGTHDKMRRTLGRTGLWSGFEGRIYSATEVPRGKPAPDIFLHAAQQMGVEPRCSVVIEDSRSGVAAARAADMRSFGYCGGLTPAEWLVGDDTVVFDDMAELAALIAAL